MLRRLMRPLPLFLLALLLVLLPAALVVLGQTGWAQRRLHEIVTRQLAEYFQREVAVGPITGSPFTTVTIEGVAVAEGQSLKDGAVITARRVAIDCDLWSVIRGRLSPVASISRIDIWGMNLRAVRDRQGVLNLSRLIRPPRVVPPAKRFRGQIVVHDSAMIYLDYGPGIRLTPLMVRATDLQAKADLSKVLRIKADVAGRILDHRADRLSAQIVTDVDGPYYNLNLTVSDLDAGWLAASLPATSDLTIPGGRIDGTGTFYQVQYLGKTRQDYSFTLRGRDVALAGRTIGREPVRLDGTVWLGSGGAKAQGLRATIAGTTYDVAGSAHLQGTPKLDLALSADRARLAPLVQALPAAYRKTWSIPTSGYGSILAQIIGPADNPNLRLRLNMQDQLTVRLADVGVIRAEGLSVTSDIVSVARKPSLRTTVAARRIEIPALKLAATTAPEFPRDITVGPMQGFRATVQLCGGKPIAQAVIQAPFIQAGEFRAARVATRLVLVDEVVRLQGLRAQALGGMINADAALQLKRPQLGVRVRGRAEGIDMARLRELPVDLPADLPDRLAGAANADFQMHITRERFSGKVSFDAADVIAGDTSVRAVSGVVGIEGDGRLSGAGRIIATGIDQEKLQLDRSEALIRFRDKDLQILSGYARGPDGVFWARGDVGLDDRTLDLQVDSAELDVGPLAERMGLKDTSGAAYISGNVTGPIDRARFTGRVTIFHPTFDRYRLSALTARATMEGDRLDLEDLTANRGATAITGRLTLSNLGAPKEQIRLAGNLSGENVDLRQVSEFTERDLPLTGLAEFDAEIGGTVDNPRASGRIRLANATYEDFVVGRAEIPFELADRRLSIAQAEMIVLDAPLGLRGTITFGDRTEVDGYLSGGQLRLEGLAPLLDSDLPIAGTATVEQVWLRGPTDELQGGARLVAQEVMIGDETIGDLTATLSLSRGQVRLHETSFQLGNGRVILSGALNTAADPDTIAAQVQLLQTDVPDILDLAVPIAAAVDERPKTKRDELQLALRSYALRLKGSVDGNVNLEGPLNSPVAMVNLTGQTLVMDGRTLPHIEAEGRVTSEAAQDLDVKLKQGDALVTIAGDTVFDGPINLDVDGTGIAMAQLRPWIPLDIPYGGRLGFTVVAAGMTSQPDLTASVDIMEPSFAGVQFDVLTVPVARVREGEIDVDTLVIKRGEQQVTVDGNLPFSWKLPIPERDGGGQRPGLIADGKISMGAHIEKTPVAFFLPLIDEYLRAKRPPAPVPTAEPAVFRWTSIKTEGEVNSAVEVTGTVKEPTLRGNFGVANATMLPETWKTPLSGVQADLQFSGTGYENEVRVASLSGKYDNTVGEITGKFGLNYFTREDFWRNAFDLKLALSADVQALPGGTDISGLKGALLLKTEDGAQVVRPENFKFKIGGGTAELTGLARFTDFRVPNLAENQYDLHFKLADSRVRYRPYLDAIANGDLNVVTPADQTRAVVSGNWELRDGAMSLVAPAGGLAFGTALRSRYPSPALDITAGIGPGLQLRGSGVRAPLQADPTAAQLTGTPQHPRLVGTIVTGRGTTTLPTATLRLRGLSVQYVLEPTPGDRSDPVSLRLRGMVDGTAETTITRPGDRPIYILVRIAGALPDQVTMTATAEPPLTEMQIYALLGGVPFAYLPGIGGTEGGLGQVVSEQFLASLATAFRMRIFEPIQEELERALGLELGITFAFNQPITLQIGKYVLKNLLITYERPLAEGGSRFDVRISYELPAGLRITYHNDERNINQIEIGYSFTF